MIYDDRLAERTKELREAERAADRLGNLRLGLAIIALVLVLLPVFVKSGGPWWALIGVALAFLWLGKQHDLASHRIRRARAAVRFYQDGIARRDEKWRNLPDDGSDLPDSIKSGTIYADDLDLFGKASLFQLLVRATTHLGRRRLAEYLITPRDAGEVLRRQDAVRELAGKLELREQLIVAAAGEDATPLDDKHLLEWAETGQPMKLAGLLRVLGIVQPIFLIGAGLMYYATARYGIVLLVAIGLHVLTLLLTRKEISARAEVLSGPDRALSRYANLIEAIEKFEVSSPMAVELRGRLATGTAGESASEQIRKLHSIVNYLDARLNAFFGLSIGPITLWDLNWVLAAERFRETTGRRLRGWLDAIAELEALSSMAGLLYDRPDYCLPTVAADAGTFESIGLAHPLIDRRRVSANDLTLGGRGSVLLLSGSNMSGKSTLLRAVGLAFVMFRAGGPVAARSLSFGMMRLVTSVRIVDSLAQGTSHFYAELKRLKLIVDEAKIADPPALYLLDEMLHGTNSRERYIGAVSVIRWLSQQGAIGIVTTHDLALARIEEELSKGLVINRHFSDEVAGGEIHFDYRLREGKVSSTNALRLMKAVGIDVDFRDLPPAAS